jgi:hypothetical protein
MGAGGIPLPSTDARRVPRRAFFVCLLIVSPSCMIEQVWQLLSTLF